MYVDASFTNELGCVVFLSKEKCWMHRFLIPTKYTKNQQLAELYAALFALHIILRDGLSEILLIGDNNGVLGTLYSLRTPSKNFPKLHLNSRLSRTIGRLRGFVHIRWCASGAMLADSGSRNFCQPIGKRISTILSYKDFDPQSLEIIPHTNLNITTGLNPPRLVNPRL